MTRPLAAPGHAAGTQIDDLYAEHGRMVLGLCRSLLRDTHEAEDASQQTFLSAYRSLLGGARPRDTGAWIATIARNECRALIKRRMATPPPVDLDVESGRADPADLAAERAELADLKAALAELPARQREAVVLRDLYGLSYDEVSVAMGSSAPAVESLLSRARGRLAGRLRDAAGLARSPLAAFVGLRDALERLLSALGGPAGQAGGGGAGGVALAKLGTAAAVTVAAGAVALEPVIDERIGPARAQPVRPAQVQSVDREPARGDGSIARVPFDRPIGLRSVSQDAQHRRPAPGRPPSESLARTGGDYGNPDSTGAAAAAAQPHRPGAPAPSQPPPPAAGGHDTSGPSGPVSGADPKPDGSDSSGSGSSGSGSSGSGDSGSSGSGSGGYDSGSGSSGSGSYGSGGSGSGSYDSGSSGSGSSGSGSSGSGSSGSGDYDSSGSGSGSSGSGSSGSGSGGEDYEYGDEEDGGDNSGPGGGGEYEEDNSGSGGGEDNSGSGSSGSGGGGEDDEVDD